MEYYLQSDQTGRVFIDSEVHKDCAIERTIIADDWTAARDKVDEREFVPRTGHGFFLDFFQSNRNVFCK